MAVILNWSCGLLQDSKERGKKKRKHQTEIPLTLNTQLHPSWVTVQDKHLSETAYPFSSCQGDYRITELLRLQWNSWDHLVQPPCGKVGLLELVSQNCVQSGFQYINREFTTLDNVFQCLITLTGNFFIIKNSCIIYKELKLHDAHFILSHLSDTKHINFHARYRIIPFSLDLTFYKSTLFLTNFSNHWKQLES